MMGACEFITAIIARFGPDLNKIINWMEIIAEVTQKGLSNVLGNQIGEVTAGLLCQMIGIIVVFWLCIATIICLLPGILFIFGLLAVVMDTFHAIMMRLCTPYEVWYAYGRRCIDGKWNAYNKWKNTKWIPPTASGVAANNEDDDDEEEEDKW
jgi:hypothetical protein